MNASLKARPHPRHSRLPRFVAAAALALLALSGRPGPAAKHPSSTAKAAPRPNIVLVMADDLDQLLGTMDHTPNIARLVRDQGISLDRYYITDSLCCPSRTSYLRGQYAHNHGVLTNTAPDGGYQKLDSLGLEASTWPPGCKPRATARASPASTSTASRCGTT